MLRLQRITTSDTELYNYVEKLLVASFPDNEYRPLKQWREYTDGKKHFYNNVIFNDNTPIGVITYWDFGTFYYAEHFAIAPQQRNGGFGKKALNQLCQTLKLPIVLEVEMPDNEMAQRRIGFYQRQGFTLWSYPYKQPPYKQGDDFLPMYLMVYGDLQCEKDVELVKECIYREVYGIEQPAH